MMSSGFACGLLHRLMGHYLPEPPLDGLQHHVADVRSLMPAFTIARQEMISRSYA